jgi:predicted nuclease of predicted toxin-antitoxin system
VKLVLDEHLSPAIGEELRRQGQDGVAASEAGLRGRPDAEFAAWAIAEGRAVVTADYADFRAIHDVYMSRGERHFGIMLVSRRFSLAQEGFGRLIAAVEELLKEPGPRLAVKP